MEYTRGAPTAVTPRDGEKYGWFSPRFSPDGEWVAFFTTTELKKIKVAGSGLLSRAMQHELDHLDGKLYIDYLESMDELIPVGQADDAETEEASKALA